MPRICVFAGTSEGRKLVEYLLDQGLAVMACVATEYGASLLGQRPGLSLSSKRLDQEQIQELLAEQKFDLVVDATHPHASLVSQNIDRACRAENCPYWRLLRSRADQIEDSVLVESPARALDYLQSRPGKILLTTGSKDLALYSRLKDFKDRVYARVLPLADSLQACLEAGLAPSQIIAMQGPFSVEMNLATLKATGAKYLVTKEAGARGGFSQKLAAAKLAGAQVIVIGRPVEETGYTYAQTIRYLADKYQLSKAKVKLKLVGLGPGDKSAMTDQVRQALDQADCLIGAKRLLAASARPDQVTIEAISAQAIYDQVEAWQEGGQITIVMSGDPGFYSGAKKLLPLLKNYDLEVIPGLSSLSYFAAKIQTNYDDVTVISRHGRAAKIVERVLRDGRVFCLLSGARGVNELCQELVAAGLDQARVAVGQRLSYADEKICRGKAIDLLAGTYDPLSVALVENVHDLDPQLSNLASVSPGLPDRTFTRILEKGQTVPMTKSELRAVCLAKLQVHRDSICWDIGAGTGSVAIELARLAERGRVYAVERRDLAADLLAKNLDQLQVDRVQLLTGSAPQACEDLPAPDRVFIGGSAGRIREIIDLVLTKNDRARIVATAISLETIAELTACLKAYAWQESEVVSVQVSRNRQAGPYQLMQGQNPVYIFTFQA